MQTDPIATAPMHPDTDASTRTGEDLARSSGPPELSDVPAPAREVLALFAGPLAGVRFPDLDEETLDALAREVAARAATLEEARAALQRARVGLAESQRAILQATDKGLAYARVYAGAEGELGERVERLLAARAPAKSGRRGRRRKRSTPTPSVDGVDAGAARGKLAELPLAGVA